MRVAHAVWGVTSRWSTVGRCGKNVRGTLGLRAALGVSRTCRAGFDRSGRTSGDARPAGAAALPTVRLVYGDSFSKHRARLASRPAPHESVREDTARGGIMTAGPWRAWGGGARPRLGALHRVGVAGVGEIRTPCATVVRLRGSRGNERELGGWKRRRARRGDDQSQVPMNGFPAQQSGRRTGGMESSPDDRAADLSAWVKRRHGMRKMGFQCAPPEQEKDARIDMRPASTVLTHTAQCRCHGCSHTMRSAGVMAVGVMKLGRADASVLGPRGPSSAAPHRIAVLPASLR
ncbi:hypothetical protein MRB53_042404 [Persea americana]|nr:hypothetical protein MRB53_042404 [Persea americana]